MERVSGIAPSGGSMPKTGVALRKVEFAWFFDSKLRVMAENLTHDVVYFSEIEGIHLNVDWLKSCITFSK